MPRTFTFYEFFAGGGMARLGLGPRWSCLFANDSDRVKAATYCNNFGSTDFREGDVWQLDTADLPGHADLAWASTPCQDFSLAGARAGLAGHRSSAFYGFWRLIETLNGEGRAPRIVVLENVPGLLTSHGGKDFEAIQQSLTSQGYAFRVFRVNAADFVPQSRVRVLVVGARSDIHIPCLWPETAPRVATLSELLEPDEEVRWDSADETAAIIALMDARNRLKLADARAAQVRRVGAVFRRVRKSGQRSEVRFDDLAGCLRTPRGGSSRQSVIVTENDRVRSRLLTPRETARLMGLPESYRLPRAATAAFHLTGDGVVVPMVRHLAAAILEPLLTGEAASAAA